MNNQTPRLSSSTSPTPMSNRASLIRIEEPQRATKRTRHFSTPIMKARDFFSSHCFSKVVAEKTKAKPRAKSAPTTSEDSKSSPPPPQPRLVHHQRPPIYKPPKRQYSYDFYGNRKIVLIVYHYLRQQYGCADQSTTSTSLRQPPLLQFISDLVHQSNAPYEVLADTILILQCLKNKFACTGSAGRSDSNQFVGHTFFFAAFLVAMDHYYRLVPAAVDQYTDEFWSTATGYPVNTIVLQRDRMWLLMVKARVTVRRRKPWTEALLRSVGWPFDGESFDEKPMDE